jgi:hypothetical protein
MKRSIDDITFEEEPIVTPEPIVNPAIYKVAELRAIVQDNGVNTSIMSSLEELCPEAIPENAPVNTFTEQFSTTNLTYALEAFDKAVELL